MEREKELEDIFKDVDENKKKLIRPLIEQIVFIEEQMTYLKTLPFIRLHPYNNSIQEVTKASKQYKDLSQAYMNAIRVLILLLNKEDTSAENELLERLKGFKI